MMRINAATRRGADEGQANGLHKSSYAFPKGIKANAIAVASVCLRYKAMLENAQLE